MLTKNNSIQRDQLEMIALDQIVPANHLVRKIEAAIDFSFNYPLVDIEKSAVQALALLY